MYTSFAKVLVKYRDRVKDQDRSGVLELCKGWAQGKTE